MGGRPAQPARGRGGGGLALRRPCAPGASRPLQPLNYALGLTRIPLLTTPPPLVAMPPGTAVYAWPGHAGRSALAGGEEAALRYGPLGLAARRGHRLPPEAGAAPASGAHDPMGRGRTSLADRLIACTAGTQVIDVRGGGEFTGPLGHIPAAVNVPLDRLADRLSELAKNEPVVVVCRTDKRSAKAARMLHDAGFGAVSVLHRGMEAWNEAGIRSSPADKTRARDEVLFTMIHPTAPSALTTRSASRTRS